MQLVCCFVGQVSFIFFAGGRNKQNKFPSNLHSLIKKLNPFYRYYLSLSYLSAHLSSYTCCNGRNYMQLEIAGFVPV
jgi:hypothetical protein